MNGEDAVKEIAKTVGGEIKEMGRLPDGSGFAVMSMPLPADHWLTREGYNVPPMPFRMGSRNRLPLRTVFLDRQEMSDRIRAAGKYAIRAATMNGKDMDFDPDAMIQNLLVGMLGYWTADGLSSEESQNPKPRTQWCCEGKDGNHDRRCRNNPENKSLPNAAQL